MKAFQYIEARQFLFHQVVKDAVVLINDGFDATNCQFDNCAFVCEDELVLQQFLRIAPPGVHPTRVVTGDITTAEYILENAALTPIDDEKQRQ